MLAVVSSYVRATSQGRRKPPVSWKEGEREGAGLVSGWAGAGRSRWAAVRQNPQVCELEAARRNCPLTCKTAQACYETEKAAAVYYVYDRTRLILPQAR